MRRTISTNTAGIASSANTVRQPNCGSTKNDTQPAVMKPSGQKPSISATRRPRDAVGTNSDSSVCAIGNSMPMPMPSSTR